MGSREIRRAITTSAEERASIARALDLLALNQLTAEVSLRRTAAGLIEVAGRIEADLIQACVVTLEPVPARVSDSFRLHFGETALPPDPAEIDLDYEEMDPPDPIVDGTIDLGPILVEHLSLALDPYPRKPGAAVPEEFEPKPDEAAENTTERTHKPFSGLDKLLK